MNKGIRRLRSVAMIALLIIAMGCSSENPLNQVLRDYSAYDEFTVLLEDMMEEGNFIHTYSHKFKIVFPDMDSQVTEWTKVPKKFFIQHANHLGMALLSKKEGVVVREAAPPGYHYVGNSRYGEWRPGSGGRSFWHFYGQYRMFSDIFGSGRRPIYRSDYNAYDSYRKQNRTFYGSSNQYGTNGTETKQTHKNFFARRQAKSAASKKSFSNRVKNRTSRTSRSSSGYRGRGSSGGGK